MPELPEVETIAAGVHARVHGARILRVWTGDKPQSFKSPAEEIVRALTGSRIASVRRVGKTIVMTVERKSVPTEFLIHLGMTGRLLVSAPEVPLAAHTHAVLTLDDGREVRFVDPRRFGRLSLQTADTPYTGPGSEPLTISQSDFVVLFHQRRTPIKAALLNQSLLHGIGNIYADESLFRASVRPTRQAASLTRAELARLRASLVEVLRHAIQLGGSSVSDYVDADGARGFFQLEHRVYQRTNQPCLVCKSPIRRIALAGRSTHFCPRCQK
jgi:formamidopyrimidine-DNA glycosylase